MVSGSTFTTFLPNVLSTIKKGPYKRSASIEKLLVLQVIMYCLKIKAKPFLIGLKITKVITPDK